MNTRPLLTAALLVATAMPSARAATVLTYYEKPAGTQGKATERRLVLAAPRLRMETAGTAAGGGAQVLLFNAADGTLYVIDEAKRSYTELRATVIPMNEEEVKTGPGGKPGKPGKGAAPAPPPVMTGAGGTVYKKVDSGFIVDGFRTDKYEGTRDGRKVEDLYVTEPKSVGVAAGDLDTLHALARIFVGPAASEAWLGLTAKVPGLPVRVLRYEGDKPVLQIDLGEVGQQDVPAARFELPEGLTRLAQGLGQ